MNTTPATTTPKTLMKPITSALYIDARSERALYTKIVNALFSEGWRHSGGLRDAETLFHHHGRESLLRLDAQNKQFHHIEVDVYTLPKTITASEFIAQYLTEDKLVGPATPPNPPNFYISTEGIPALCKVAQQLAFDAGIDWFAGTKALVSYDFNHLLVVRKADPASDREWAKNCLYHGRGRYKDVPVYSAATQLGEIVRLLSTPVEPPVPPAPTPPEIHGYKAVYTPGTPTVDFGCAQLGKNLLRDAAKLMGCVINSDGSVMRGAGIVPEQGCNRWVAEITLSSNKNLDSRQIKEILGYIAAVEEYAKKYPQKS